MSAAKSKGTDPNMKFIFEKTEDGSPTVRILSGSDGDDHAATTSEAMHSLKGAFSETLYIYGTAIKTALGQTREPEVLSMGLGLGYVEILSAALFLKNGFQPRGESFEIVPELREWFQAWLRDQLSVPQDFRSAYDEILARTAAHAEVPQAEIKIALRDAVAEGAWLIRPELTAATTLTPRFSCICFDAFSSKTTPDLWTEDFLQAFFAKACSPRCVLSTYACTGALKRSLRAAGFDLRIREGFSSKRDSTFAVRS